MTAGTAAEAWKTIAHDTARLVERYLADAATTDQRTQIVNLASLLRHASAFNAAIATEVEHYADSEAVAVGEKLQAVDALADAEARIRQLESELAAARGQRDTANAAGGVL